MNALLAEALSAHGGLDAWRQWRSLSSSIITGGALWTTKGVGSDGIQRRVTTERGRQWTSIAPFGDPDWRMVFEPQRVAIETSAGVVIAERDNPRDAFAGHGWATPWDPLHLAYFNGYAMWLYHAAPFVLAEPGFDVADFGTLAEEGRTLRGLRVRMPPHIHSHCAEQVFYFDEDGLLRRHDYQVDIAGGHGAAHLVSDYVEVGQLRLPTRRRVYRKAPDGSVQRGEVLVSIDLSAYTPG